MFTVIRAAISVAVVVALGASPLLAHEPDRDYRCLGDCIGVGIRDEETGQETLLLEGVLDRMGAGTESATAWLTTEIGPIWIADGRWDVTLKGLCEHVSEAPDGSIDGGPVDAVISLEFELLEGGVPATTVSLDVFADEGTSAIGAHDENSPFQSTTQPIVLGPSGWGIGQHRITVSMSSDAANLCAWYVAMTSVPEGASG